METIISGVNPSEQICYMCSLLNWLSPIVLYTKKVSLIVYDILYFGYLLRFGQTFMYKSFLIKGSFNCQTFCIGLLDTLHWLFAKRPNIKVVDHGTWRVSYIDHFLIFKINMDIFNPSFFSSRIYSWIILLNREKLLFQFIPIN